MRLLLLQGGLLAVALTGGAWWLAKRQPAGEAVFEPRSRILEPAPLCPWRQPEVDLRRFFSGATRWLSETRVLSGQLLELRRRLGRDLQPEELALQVHRVFRNSEELGAVLVRCVHGECGAIEIVLAIDPQGTVVGLELQRQREPAAIAAALTSPDWLGAFRGLRAADFAAAAPSLPAVSAPARSSADAIADGVRSLLILYQTAQAGGAASAPIHRHH